MAVNIAWIDDNQTIRAEVPFALIVYPVENNQVRFMFHMENREQLAVLGGSVIKLLLGQEVFEASLNKAFQSLMNEHLAKLQGKR